MFFSTSGNFQHLWHYFPCGYSTDILNAVNLNVYVSLFPDLLLLSSPLLSIQWFMPKARLHVSLSCPAAAQTVSPSTSFVESISYASLHLSSP